MFDFHLLFNPKKEIMVNLGFENYFTDKNFSFKPSKDKITLIETINENDVQKGAIVYPYNGKIFSSSKLIRSVAEKNAAIEIPLSPIFDMGQFEKASFLASARKILKLCVKYNAHYIITSRARNEFELKSPIDLISFGVSLGLSYDQAKMALLEFPKMHSVKQ